MTTAKEYGEQLYDAAVLTAGAVKTKKRQSPKN